MYIYNASDELVYTSVTDSEGKGTEENYGVMYKEQDSQYNYDSATGNSTQSTALEIADDYRISQSAVTDWFGREKSHTTTVYNIAGETEQNPATTLGKITTEYSYSVATDGKTSSNIEKYINKTYNGDGTTVRVFDGYSYEYDKQNRISAIKQVNALGNETEMYSYEYDKLGQLVRYNDKIANKSYTYTYDGNGNITKKSEYAYTTGVLTGEPLITTYSYEGDWADMLTSVDGEQIEYDSIGNPTSYLGATLTWEGRELTSYSNDEYTSTYEYDENGMRYRTTITNKEDNSVGYLDYVWVDSKLISISFTSDELNQTVKYLYNDFDEPVGFVSTREDGSVDTYYYLKNAQCDITHIVSAAGKKMVTFTYDVFGKRTVTYQANGSTTPGQIELLTQMKADLLNPFAYRGYCYDYDMGMYYLQSRYYDPNVGRFINADDTNYLNATGTVLGCNLFAYCENDAVNKVDPKGNLAITSAIKTVLAVLMGAAAYLIEWFVGKYILKDGTSFNWKNLLLCVVISVIDSWVSLKKVKNITSFAVSFIGTFISSISSSYSIFEVFVISLIISLVATLISDKITSGSKSLNIIAHYNNRVSVAWKKMIKQNNYKILRQTLHKYFKWMNNSFKKYISSSILSSLFDASYKVLYNKIKKKIGSKKVHE